MLKSFKAYISESIHDKYLFKAIILAGGPASGKSFIAKKMFSGLGVQFVDSDIFFEKFLKDFEFPKYVKNDDPSLKERDILRSWAKELTNKQYGQWVNGMLPLVIDGTGKNYEKIETQYKKLNNIGYDCTMIFVNTSIDVAKKRNEERYKEGGRRIDDKMVQEFWDKAQSNIGKFQRLFHNKFYVIDNNEILKGHALHDFTKQMHNMATKILKEPITNNKGKEILDTLEKEKKLYLADLKNNQFPKYDIV